MKNELQDESKWMTRKQAAEYCRKSIETLDRYRKMSGGAFEIKLPTGSILLDRDALDNWLTGKGK